MELGLSGKIALVAGGGSGIGLECGAVLAAEGATVVLADIDGEAAAQGASALRGQGHAAEEAALDITDGPAVGRLAERVLAAHGRLDVLVNSAGIVGDKLFLDSTEAEWRRELEVNLIGPMLCTQAFLPAMIEQGGGRIITLASDAARVGQARLSYYAAARRNWASSSASDRVVTPCNGSHHVG